MPDFLTAALYKFVELPDFAALQAPILAACQANAETTPTVRDAFWTYVVGPL